MTLQAIANQIYAGEIYAVEQLAGFKLVELRQIARWAGCSSITRINHKGRLTRALVVWSASRRQLMQVPGV